MYTLTHCWPVGSIFNGLYLLNNTKAVAARFWLANIQSGKQDKCMHKQNVQKTVHTVLCTQVEQPVGRKQSDFSNLVSWNNDGELN